MTAHSTGVCCPSASHQSSVPATPAWCGMVWCAEAWCCVVLCVVWRGVARQQSDPQLLGHVRHASTLHESARRHINTHAHTRTEAYKHTCTHAHKHMHAHTHKHMHAHIQTHACAHTNTCVRTRKHIHAHKHTHARGRTRTLLREGRGRQPRQRRRAQRDLLGRGQPDGGEARRVHAQPHGGERVEERGAQAQQVARVEDGEGGACGEQGQEGEGQVCRVREARPAGGGQAAQVREVARAGVREGGA